MAEATQHTPQQTEKGKQPGPFSSLVWNSDKNIYLTLMNQINMDTDRSSPKPVAGT